VGTDRRAGCRKLDRRQRLAAIGLGRTKRLRPKLTPVDDQDYQAPFAFTGKLGKITLDLGESTASPQAIKVMMEELAKQRDR